MKSWIEFWIRWQLVLLAVALALMLGGIAMLATSAVPRAIGWALVDLAALPLAAYTIGLFLWVHASRQSTRLRWKLWYLTLDYGFYSPSVPTILNTVEAYLWGSSASVAFWTERILQELHPTPQDKDTVLCMLGEWWAPKALPEGALEAIERHFVKD